MTAWQALWIALFTAAFLMGAGFFWGYELGRRDTIRDERDRWLASLERRQAAIRRLADLPPGIHEDIPGN